LAGGEACAKAICTKKMLIGNKIAEATISRNRDMPLLLSSLQGQVG
jgi:hypothetical protein